MFRWKGIIVLIVIVIIFIVLGLLLTDRWLEGQLENFGSSIVGAKVEIDNLDVSLTNLKVGWTRLQVTHPQHTMKNMIETANCEFDMEFWPLLRKKIIIEDFQMQGLRTFTDRETDGALTKEEKEKTEGFVYKTMNKLSKKAESAASTRIGEFKSDLNIDSVMSMVNLQSIEKMDSLKNALTTTYDKWNTKLKESEIESDIKTIETGLKNLDVKKIDDIQKLQKALNTADDIKKTVEKLEKEYKEIKDDFTKDYEESRKSLKQVDNWIKADYDQARAKAKLPDFSVENIGMMIFGEQAANRFNTYLGYAGTARKYASKLKSDKPKKVKPPRLKGQDIPFPDKNARPDFWIKRISLSGETSDQIKLSGEVLNIVDNQKFIQKPTEAKISGTRDDGAKLSLDAVFDYRSELPMENYNASFTGFSMANTQLSKSKMLPNKVKTGTGSVLTSLKLEGESIKGKITFIGDRLVFEFKSDQSKRNKIEQIIRDVLADIKKVEFIAYVSGTRDDLVFRLSSNLDEEISKGLKASIAKEIEAARKKIEQRIDKEVSKYRTQLDEVVKEKEAQLQTEIAKYQKKVDEQRAKVNEKKEEIEKKIDSEKKKLEKKAKNKLKDLLN
jgi:uncharacterized protein (TIGR03545 family)